MTTAVLCVLVTLLLAPAAAAANDAPADPNTLSAQEKADGWTLLFDGRNTDAWRGYRKDGFPSGWLVEDGVLIVTGGGGDLVTREQFADFELSVDWQVGPRGNSGIMFRVAETKNAPYETGIEMQILDNRLHPDGKNPLTSAGSCYALYAPLADVARPAGQWNTARIVARGPKIQQFLNGELVAEYEIGSAEWKQRIAGSKFRDWADFAKPTRGHIALQDHGDRVMFRNLKIRKLDAK
jgi:hypothetical protein